MQRFGHAVVKHRKLILIVGILLLIPSVFGYLGTRINYAMLDYLPSDMDTVVGQNILKEDFGKGAFTLLVTEDMTDKEVADLTENIAKVPHVVDALSYQDLTNTDIPEELIPDDVRENFIQGDSSLIAVFLDSGTSSDESINAVTQIRRLCGDDCYVSGMTALVIDLKNMCEREEPTYVAIAVICALVLLLLLTDSFLAPFLFLISIAMAIVYNMGSNIFLGEISYITKALAAVLQLAVTMDYSIFLWHSYEEHRELHPGDPYTAMAEAIAQTLTAIFSSACTASAGFLAMCFMSYTMGADLGIVMAKGCMLGLLASVTLLPSLILVCNPLVEKTGHKGLIREGKRLGKFVTNHYWVFLVIFVVVLIPAFYGFQNKPISYDFSHALTGNGSQIAESDIPFKTADEKLEEKFDIKTTEMVLCKSDLSHPEAKEMLDRIEDVDGVKYALGYDSFAGGMIDINALPESLSSALISGDYQLIVINSSYAVSTDEVNEQIDAINEIIKEYDPDAMLIGEAPATKDLITTTDRDFMVVDAISIVAILLILFVVFKSAVLPFILVLAIEFAIFINLGIPYYMNDVLLFIVPVCISTIQLGSTVNYAILQTTRYRKERNEGKPKKEAISTALNKTMPSIVTSGLSFFAATFGVSLYSNIGIISSITTLMARGAIISTLSVIFILPAIFMLLDKVIVKTSKGFKPGSSTKWRSGNKNSRKTEEVNA
ncbi:MAG: efflux RND transporter permease subunit [Coriobacteriales bacterium]|jgi:predicted RND superfamily exporter protein